MCLHQYTVTTVWFRSDKMIVIMLSTEGIVGSVSGNWKRFLNVLRKLGHRVVQWLEWRSQTYTAVPSVTPFLGFLAACLSPLPVRSLLNKGQ